MRRYSVSSFSIPERGPIADLNTTPLIDVMLVLLIMFIMTVPVVSHKIAVDLPAPPPPDAERLEPAVYRLTLERDGGLTWNGMPVAESSLPARLAALRSEAASELHLAADGAARYEDYDRLLAVIKGAGITRLGLVGNARFAEGF
jgi:biopolymer transport protein ExbD